MPRRLIAALAGASALVGVLTACSSVIDGSGRPVAGSSVPLGLPTPTLPGNPTPTEPGFPAPSGSLPPSVPPSAPAATVSCPTVTAPQAHLRFGCIDNGLTQADDPIWPLSLAKQVEPNWQLAEGAGLFGSADGHSLRTITEAVRSQMMQNNSYGPDPKVETRSSKAAKIGGADAWVLQTQFTIDPTYRQQQQLKVKTERLWIAAITIAPNDISLWFVTVPDDVSDLWAKVPALIDGIRVI